MEMEWHDAKGACKIKEHLPEMAESFFDAENQLMHQWRFTLRTAWTPAWSKGRMALIYGSQDSIC